MDGGPNAADWINTALGVGTLAAASVAGYFARKAAIWTEAQARSAAAQVDVADAALEVARQDARAAQAAADVQRSEGERTARSFAESRIDSEMPSLLALAHPGWSGDEYRPPLEVGTFGESAGEVIWAEVTEPLEFKRDAQVVFRMNAMIRLQNFSDYVAQVPVIEAAGGDVSVGSGSSALVLPHDEAWITWTRLVRLGTFHPAESMDPTLGLLNLLIWVRDLGMRAYDEVRFNASTMHYQLDGSRFVIGPPPPWVENVGQPVRRVYERFETPET